MWDRSLPDQSFCLTNMNIDLWHESICCFLFLLLLSNIIICYCGFCLHLCSSLNDHAILFWLSRYGWECLVFHKKHESIEAFESQITMVVVTALLVYLHCTNYQTPSARFNRLLLLFFSTTLRRLEICCDYTHWGIQKNLFFPFWSQFIVVLYLCRLRV